MNVTPIVRFIVAPVVIAGGVAMLAIPVAVWLSVDRHTFLTEGSPAGTILGVVVGSFAFVAGIGGIVFTLAGVVLFAAGRGASGLRATGAILVVPFLVYAAAHGLKGRFVGPAHSPSAANSPPQARTAPAPRGSRDGPSLPGAEVPRVEIAITFPFEATAKLTLYRDAEAAAREGERAGPAPGDESAPLWIAKEPGGWHLVGIDCGASTMVNRDAIPAAVPGTTGCHAPGRLKRWMPALFGLARVPMGAAYRDGECRMSFSFHERVAVLRDPRECFSPRNLMTLSMSATRLERMARDAAAER